MSWTDMRKFIEGLPDGLSADDRSLLFVLRARQGDNRSCFPGRERLIRETGLPERSLRRSISRLKVLGLLRVSRNNDDHRSNDYELNLPAKVAAIRTKKPASVAAIRAGNSGQRRSRYRPAEVKIPASVAPEGLKKESEGGATLARYADEQRAPLSEKERAQRAAEMSELLDRLSAGSASAPDEPSTETESEGG